MSTLRSIRQSLNFSQSEVAAKVGKHVTDISQAELGDLSLSPEFASKLAAVYDVPADRLMELSQAAQTFREVTKGLSALASLDDVSEEQALAIANHMVGVAGDPTHPEEIQQAAVKVLEKLNGVVSTAIKAMGETAPRQPDRDLYGRARRGRNNNRRE